MIKRPSQYLPDGVWKYVSPLGGRACPNTAERPPVSEFESPKLKMAGKLHDDELIDMAALCITTVTHIRKPRITLGEWWASIDVEPEDINQRKREMKRGQRLES